MWAPLILQSAQDLEQQKSAKQTQHLITSIILNSQHVPQGNDTATAHRHCEASTAKYGFVWHRKQATDKFNLQATARICHRDWVRLGDVEDYLYFVV